MSLFEKGRPKTGGRARGARNKLSQAFLEAFATDFEQHGAEVIKIVRVEKPHEYLKTAAYLMPKEFEITETHLMEIAAALKQQCTPPANIPTGGAGIDLMAPRSAGVAAFPEKS